MSQDEEAKEPSDIVREILHELKNQANTMRSVAVAMEKNIRRLHGILGTFGRSEEPWVKTFLDEGVMIDLGANTDLASVMIVRANGVLHSVQSLASVALGALAKGATGDDVDRMANALATGMTESASSCTCGICASCKLIDARGVEVALPEIHRRMRDAITVPRDQIRDPSLQKGLIIPGRTN